MSSGVGTFLKIIIGANHYWFINLVFFICQPSDQWHSTKNISLVPQPTYFWKSDPDRVCPVNIHQSASVRQNGNTVLSTLALSLCKCIQVSWAPEPFLLGCEKGLGSVSWAPHPGQLFGLKLVDTGIVRLLCGAALRTDWWNWASSKNLANMEQLIFCLNNFTENLTFATKLFNGASDICDNNFIENLIFATILFWSIWYSSKKSGLGGCRMHLAWCGE